MTVVLDALYGCTNHKLSCLCNDSHRARVRLFQHCWQSTVPSHLSSVTAAVDMDEQRQPSERLSILQWPRGEDDQLPELCEARQLLLQVGA